ncbi:MAG: hypothetical protein H0V29_02030 [Thermoleophilaceae bacterium]|nr:hypothetical protein [Thermoleophilaceae bacterium]
MGRKRLLALARVVERFGGSKLCFGEEVRSGDYAIVPVARVRAAGGGGFGREGESDTGGGGGGALEAQPVGYVEIGPAGTKFKRIRATTIPEVLARALTGTAAAAAIAAVARNRDWQVPKRTKRLLSR